MNVPQGSTLVEMFDENGDSQGHRLLVAGATRRGGQAPKEKQQLFGVSAKKRAALAQLFSDFKEHYTADIMVVIDVPNTDSASAAVRDARHYLPDGWELKRLSHAKTIVKADGTKEQRGTKYRLQPIDHPVDSMVPTGVTCPPWRTEQNE